MRHREALRSMARWSIAPLIPGLIIFRWGMTEIEGSINWVANVMIVVILVAVYLLNIYAANALKRQIDALPEPD